MSVKKILFVVSVVFNVLFILAAVFIINTPITAFGFFNLDSSAARYTHSAFIVSVPTGGSTLSFGPAEFQLRLGGQAAIQFATIHDGIQSNVALEALFDHSVVSVQSTPFGLLVAGINQGETVLQVFSPQGFRDIARIFVY